ncbi:hypothetical protein [Saccharopolyspora phatthalungensis]|uniref:Uncharacterized protein n=1 Tax=Saccharopolyspora phatthalungensis TaxID=664693 RepID=A0A840QJB1_9PSEU|nr:hypothetical protein [Saccharopolyspora phatthalungensis]MBB5159198.1 hypothetical protein [Saccharopolyspora phatthalungensis]
MSVARAETDGSHRRDERSAGLAQRIGLTAVPQVLMRFGLPMTLEVGDR